MGKIILKESELIKLIEIAMDLDIYSQSMETPVGRRNANSEDSIQEIMDKLKEILYILQSNKEISSYVKNDIFKNVDNINNLYDKIKYSK
jgi:hypothetical protein